MLKRAKKIIKKTASKPAVEKSKTQTEGIKKIKIRVIGIGGGGGSIVSEIASKIPKVSFVAANTDLQALRVLSRKVLRFPFGENLTRGLGAGMNAELGREAALTEKEKIKKICQGQDLCIFVVSLGGGAGSGAIPIFAKIAKSLGNLTYGIFTLPFKFEGEKKAEIAKEALKKVRNYLNALSIIPNERVFQIIGKETPLKQALSIVNKNLADSLQGLIETLYLPGLINIDFADFKTILEGQGRLAYLNTVEVQRKEDAIKELIEKVLTSPFYPYSIKGARGVLFNIAGEKNLSLTEVDQISKTISELANPEAKIIFGISQSQKHSDTVKTTLLANGCGLKLLSSKEKKKRAKRPVRKIVKKIKQAKKEKKEGVFQEKTAIKPKTKKGRRSPKQKKTRIKIKVKKEEKPEEKTQVASPKQILVQNNGQEQIRKNALQIRKEAEEVEREMLERESIWDTPAFLRRKLAKEE